MKKLFVSCAFGVLLLSLLFVSQDTFAQCPTDLVPTSVAWGATHTTTKVLGYGPTGPCNLIITYCERLLIGFPTPCLDGHGNVVQCTTMQRYVSKVQFSGDCSTTLGYSDADLIILGYDELWNIPAPGIQMPCNPNLNPDGIPYPKLSAIRSICWRKSGSAGNIVYTGIGCDDEGAKCIMTCDVCYDGNGQNYLAHFNCIYTQQGTPNPNTCPPLIVGNMWQFEDCHQIPCGTAPGGH